jgi:hypothetical protein
MRTTHELEYFVALKRIAAYMDPEQLRRRQTTRMGLEYLAALEMAYLNMRDEARTVIRGRRLPRPARGAKL